MPELAFPNPESPWFLPFFAVMWFLMCGVLAALSGWSSLAGHFRSGQPIQGERFRFASAAIGTRWFSVSYSGCLFFTVAPTGLGLSLFFPFRVMSPALFIPWSQVESVTAKRFLFMRSTVLRIHGQWSQLRVYGRPGVSILKAYSLKASQNAL